MDLEVTIIAHVHGVAIGPDGPGVLVPTGEVEFLAAVAELVRHVVGVDLVVGVVRHVHGDSVGPDAHWIRVARGNQQGEVLGGLALAAPQLVGKNLDVGHVLRNPHGPAVAPDARGVIVITVQVEFLAAVAELVRHLVGVDLVVAAVRHVHGGSVGPDARDFS